MRFGRCVLIGMVLVGSAGLRAQGVPGPLGTTQGVTIDRLLAVVNGDVVTLSDLRAARGLRLLPGIAAMDDAAAIDALIDRRLLVAEVARYAAPDPAAEALSARRRTWEAGLPPGTDIARTLDITGMREAALTAWLRDDVRIAAHIDQRFTAAAQPTREQALTYFREHPDEFAVNGVTPDFAAVEAAVRRKLAADRRAARIAEWMATLRSRAEIRKLS